MRHAVKLSVFGLVASVVMAPISVFAESTLSNYVVLYGASETPGRVYDAASDTTTFTYTVIGQGAEPAQYINKRLKAFKLELPVCEPQPDLDSFAPILEENDHPPFFSGPNPDIYAPEEDIIGFDFFGITWKGWHGNGGLPVLLDPDEQRSFSVTFAGNLEVGPLTAGTGMISNETGNFVSTTHSVPGASCSQSCDNRLVLSFDELTAGETLTTQYEKDGVTVTASNAIAGQLDEAAIFDTASPLPGEEALGTPNIFYGGPGQPSLDANTGTGLGNLNALRNALIIPNCSGATDSTGPVAVPGVLADAATCGAGSGSITLQFASPGQIVSADFIDIEKTGSRIIAKNNGSTVFTEAVPAVGKNSVQTLPLSHLNEAVTEVTFELAESAAIDSVVLCLTPPPVPTASPTPTPTPAPECEEKNISAQQFGLDSNARQQKNLVKRLAKRLRRNANGKRQRKFARATAKRAEALYLEAWHATWSMESVYTECADVNEQCVTSNNYQTQTSKLLADSNEFVELASGLMRRLRRARGGSLRPRDAAFENRVQSLDVANQKEASNIPAETVSCPVPSE